MSIMAIDVGLKRIGVALAVGQTVMPQTPVLRENRNQAARDVSAVLREYGAKKLVVGVPLGGSSEDEMRRRIAHFVSLLEFDGEVVYQDEAMSSFEASEIYADGRRDGRLDSIAAMIILKRYLGICA
ncbi:Holliday junction resolvase RuvX [Campylobacter showae]|uniref:Putative pre-16S rRNA nuclease n=1 Tax=Campylobacter showae CC57C TaxID=1073353 RepID=M3IL26_9BACT|nr:Holliday junction resolvase RuvX [Campylobacter showae]EMG30811.1 Holliday junction resolvase-like protein [Campylobacter showae CC57C]